VLRTVREGPRAAPIPSLRHWGPPLLLIEKGAYRERAHDKPPVRAVSTSVSGFAVAKHAAVPKTISRCAVARHDVATIENMAVDGGDPRDRAVGLSLPMARGLEKHASDVTIRSCGRPTGDVVTISQSNGTKRSHRMPSNFAT
jgi:hypothetical protein